MGYLGPWHLAVLSLHEPLGEDSIIVMREREREMLCLHHFSWA
jgi:hypothetical protein